jgi:hypothetical protein
VLTVSREEEIQNVDASKSFLSHIDISAEQRGRFVWQKLCLKLSTSADLRFAQFAVMSLCKCIDACSITQLVIRNIIMTKYNYLQYTVSVSILR